MLRGRVVRADGAWAKAIASFLGKEGKPVKLAALGTKVKKPEGATSKLKHLIAANSKLFVFDDAEQTVALK